MSNSSSFLDNGVMFVFAQNHNGSNNCKARKSIQSHAALQSFRQKRKREQEQGRNFRVLTTKAEIHFSRKIISTPPVRSRKSSSCIESSDPVHMFNATSPRLQALHHRRKYLQVSRVSIVSYVRFSML